MTPFVKWAGGKKQLLDKLREKAPKKYERYYEPFVGGGAFLFDIRPNVATIGDINEQLINVYLQLKKDAKKIIRLINELDRVPCTKEFYLETRDKYNEKIRNGELDEECAALMIYINKHCFNGLYRVNTKGLFNVPYNNREGGKSIDEVNLMNIGYFLNHHSIDIRCEDFESVCQDVKKGDFVYFDSPYLPINVTSSFVDYTKNGFSLEEHERLARLFRELDRRGALLMLSNNDVPMVYDLYEGFHIENVDVRRNINSNATKRQGKEVIVTNYKV